MLTTLDRIKRHLSVTTTAQDEQLAQWGAEGSAAIRSYLKKDIGWAIQSVTSASPGVVTCYGHGLETGDVIVISHSGTTPTLDGTRTVTRISDDTFSVGVNTTASGPDGAGTFCKTYTEYLEGTGERTQFLKNYPVRSITSVHEDSDAAYGEGTDAFASDTLLTAGTDYNLMRDGGSAGASGILVRIGSVWPRPNQSTGGLLVSSQGLSNGNIKVVYTAGYLTIPADIQNACCVMVGEIQRTADSGGMTKQSENFDYYSYSLASPSPDQPALTTVQGMLRNYKKAWW